MTTPVPHGYRPDAGRYDELIDESGQVRPHWRAVVDAWDRLGPHEVARRANTAQRRLRAESAGYVFDDEAATGLTIDALPYVIDVESWAVIERGLVQRAELLELVLADLYGPRRLFSEGVIPPGAAVAARSYQLAAVGVEPAGARLISYGADVVRDATGRMLVVRDHTDAPAGAGHALWHRSVLAAMIPDAQARLRVRPLEVWLAHMRAALAQSAVPGVASPRTVVLGPPLDHPDFVEASYLASNLGYHLAGSGDFTMRAGRIWLRALEGLEAVDVVLRRVADHAADPLELVPPSPAGVAGLLQAVRERTVSVANSLGSGVADRLWLQPFLGSVCQRLLGEPLILDQIDTLWCGDPDHRHTVLDHFDRFVLHDIDPVAPVASAFADDLDAAGADEWRRRIEEMPHRFIAQRRVLFATVPTVRTVGDESVLVPGMATIRAQAVRSGSSFVVLPGGYGRVVTPERPVIDPAPAAGKDVWVIDTDHATRRRLVAAPLLPEIDLRSSIPTRSAESLFWLGRNSERAEFVARLARLVIGRAERDRPLCETEWLTAVLFGLDVVSTGAPMNLDPARPPFPAIEERLTFALAGSLGTRVGALGDSLTHVFGGAGAVREFLSTASWRVVNSLAVERLELASGVDKGDTYLIAESLDRTVVSLAAFSGLAMESVVRGPSWRFLDLGRRIDRALLTVRLLDATLRADTDVDVRQALYAHVLAGCESLVAYRRRYRSDLRLDSMRDLLLDDETNPRSLAFQVHRIREHIFGLPAREGFLEQLAILDDIDTWRGRPGRVGDVLGPIGTGIEKLSTHLAAMWFAQPPPLQLRPQG